MNIAYNMDCLEAMRQMKDNEFDLAKRVDLFRFMWSGMMQGKTRTAPLHYG